LRLRSDHGGIDGQPFHIRIGSHRFEYPVEDALIDPAVITSFDRLIRAEAIFGQVAPTRTGAGQPQDRIEEPPSVAAWTPPALATAKHEQLQPLSLIIPDSVESDLLLKRHPKSLICHHSLEQSRCDLGLVEQMVAARLQFRPECRNIVTEKLALPFADLART